MATSTVLKWHGGKGHLAGRLWDLAHSADWRPYHVVEPFCGGASFTIEGLVRDLPYSFVINDLHKELTNFWRVLQGEESFALFQRRIEATPFSEWEWKMANRRFLLEEIDVEAAAKFFVFNRQSLAGRMKSFTGITKTRVRRRMNNEVSAWLTAVEGLSEFHSLLKKVLILDGRDAIEVIESQDTNDTLFYVDPPYLHETRASTADYAHEMSVQQHVALFDVLAGIKGGFLLSGYRSKLYDDKAEACRWKRHEFEIPNNAAGGDEKRRMTECVWMNYGK